MVGSDDGETGLFSGVEHAEGTQTSIPTDTQGSTHSPDTKKTLGNFANDFVRQASKAQLLAFAVGFVPLFLGLAAGSAPMLVATLPITLAALGATGSRKPSRALKLAVRHPGVVLFGQILGAMGGGIGRYLIEATGFLAGVLV